MTSSSWRVLTFFAGRPWPDEREAERRSSAVGLAPVLRKRVMALSKGYARRLMLALALLTPHPLLLMDEPFDGFDLRQTREVMALIRRLAADGRTLVLAIHQLADAERVCDRFVLLADGAVRGCRHARRAAHPDTAAVGQPGGSVPCAHLTSSHCRAAAPLRPLLVKELWGIVSGRALWTMLLILCPIVGFSFFQAVSLYGEASAAATRSARARERPLAARRRARAHVRSVLRRRSRCCFRSSPSARLDARWKPARSAS